MIAAPIELRRQRLADLPAQVALALLPLVPRTPGTLAGIEITPAGDGRVCLRAGSPLAVAQLYASGAAIETVTLPRAVLASIKRRHGDAERLVSDRLPGGQLGWRSFGPDATLALTSGEEITLPPWPEPGPAIEAYPLFFDPKLLSSAWAVMAALGLAVTRVRTINDGSPLGLELGIDGGSEMELEGWIRVARCSVTPAQMPEQKTGGPVFPAL